MFLLVNNRPIQSADSIGFWPIVSVSADSQNSTIGRPLSGCDKLYKRNCCTVDYFLGGPIRDVIINQLTYTESFSLI